MENYKTREPNFDYLKMILNKQPAPRPVLFEFIIGDEKMRLLTGDEYNIQTEFDRVITTIKAFTAGGYDFAPMIVRGMEFPRAFAPAEKTKSLNEEAIIKDWVSFNGYRWPKADNADFSILKRAGRHLPGNAKFVVYSHDGILENAVGIIGFDNLCYMMFDDPGLVTQIFRNIGRVIYDYFSRCLEYDEVGAIICNDDWGFNSSLMFSPAFMRFHVFPWYKKIVDLAHGAGRPVILHSCGYYRDIIDDIINEMGFDGRHSYEDKIVPVEAAYEELHPRLAVVGGIDVDFLARSEPDVIYRRAKEMLKRTRERGGYALGSGNSIPDYIPNENYLALLRAAGDAYESMD